MIEWTIGRTANLMVTPFENPLIRKNGRGTLGISFASPYYSRLSSPLKRVDVYRTTALAEQQCPRKQARPVNLDFQGP
jgi:hypothetical protein